MSLDDSMVRSSVSFMLQTSSLSTHVKCSSRAVSAIDYSNSNISQTLIHTCNQNDHGMVIREGCFLSHGNIEPSCNNVHGKLFLSHDETKEETKSIEGACDHNQSASKYEHPVFSKSNNKTYEDLTPDNIQNPLRRCKSQSILKSSSDYCSTSQLKYNTSFSILEIYEYDDNSLADSSEGNRLCYGMDNGDWKVRVVTLDDYEHDKSPKLSHTELHTAAQFQNWRLRRKKQTMHRNTQKTDKAERIKHLKSNVRQLFCGSINSQRQRQK